MTIVKPKYPYSVLINARKNSSGNWSELCRSTICGCYHCGHIFLVNEIYDWIGLDGRNADRATAICPFCGVDSVIPESSEYPLQKDFLEVMKDHWYKEEKEETLPAKKR